MSVSVRAKLMVNSVESFASSENIKMFAVGKSPYPSDDLDGDNFADFVQQGQVELSVKNPLLRGHFKPGDTFYVDFTKAEN